MYATYNELMKNGWRMKEYPGAQMAYEYLMTSDTFQKIDPVSLSSMQ